MSHILRTAPPRPEVNPFEAFVLGLALLSSLPLLAGDTGSAAIERALPDPVVVAWGTLLLLGSTLSLAGLLWPPRDLAGAVFWLRVEQAGLIPVAVAAAIYGFIVWVAADRLDDVRYVLAGQLGYAAACAWRCVQIERRLRRVTATLTGSA